MKPEITVRADNRLDARLLLEKCGVDKKTARDMTIAQLEEHIANFISLGTLDHANVVHALAPAIGEEAESSFWTDDKITKLKSSFNNGWTPGALAESYGRSVLDVQRQLVKTKAPDRNNFGAPWTAWEDEKLKSEFRQSTDVHKIALDHRRTVGGINGRLCKLGLMEYDPASARYQLTPAGHKLQSQRAADDITGGRADSIIVDDPAQQEKPERKAGEFLTPEQLDEIARTIKASQITIGPELADGTPIADAALAARVAALEHEQNAITGRIGKMRSDYVDLQKAIADTIAAEVKRTRDAWQKFEIVTQDKTHRIEGLAHKAFPKLLRAVSARTRHDKGALNIWLYGPAGTGKSTAARKLAEAFDLAFHTNGPVGSQWDIRGFTDAQGKVVSTAFRRAWEGGGVYCWDEGDGSAPAALIEANGALATGFASFPDGTVERHKDCIVIINGNLRPGAAPDATYNGRYKQDTAFVNRFIAIEWGIDEDLERALLGKLDSVGEQWVKFVRNLRKKIAQRGIKGIVVSPRQLQYGVALLDAGAELEEVMEQTVKFMFTDDQWIQVAQ